MFLKFLKMSGYVSLIAKMERVYLKKHFKQLFLK